jgi:hypothetical protein
MPMEDPGWLARLSPAARRLFTEECLLQVVGGRVRVSLEYDPEDAAAAHELTIALARLGGEINVEAPRPTEAAVAAGQWQRWRDVAGAE